MDSMLSQFENLHPVIQALLATLFTWGMTALGASAVFFMKTVKRRLLDASLGFAGGVMIAASFWSLLAPSISLSREMQLLVWVPPLIGFLLGGAFLRLMDGIVPHLHLFAPLQEAEGMPTSWRRVVLLVLAITLHNIPEGLDMDSMLSQFENLHPVIQALLATLFTWGMPTSWRRVVLLVLAITLHNIPEGLAVGVAFGAVSAGLGTAGLGGAVALALGIGLQNLPEGTAVSVPLRGEGMSRLRCFWFGQLSAVVEPVAAVVGAAAVLLMRPLLPYALAFAAGAMIFVVVEEVIPEAQRGANTDIATLGAMIGFAVMMTLDVALG